MKAIAETLKALSEEVRLRLLILLHREGELCVCDLMGALELPQSNISRHLAYLKNSGWVEARRQGVWIHYRLAPNLNPLMREMVTALARETTSITESRRDAANLQLYRQNKKGAEACQ
ncbi:MAG TPA: metalloregulator ArsR/SmtB family transcription factor [Desulfurivibrio alkaliphilus]|uniref:Metalloregulator ArsR/SmtB family transcription factor n=1 Tax=Desulfurivibrio alkaliphilus TaxID=427923 RepID=A0A7C2XVA7_9BACT|nr:metalloregulator ArsR/SmtB family transcription factor [Desulfurivibrio alkaliphilus]